MSQPIDEAKPAVELTHQGGFIGDACSEEEPCSDGFRCRTSYENGAGAFPSGFCTSPCPKDSCFDHADYPLTRCVTADGHREPFCAVACSSTADCRDGYVCTHATHSSHTRRYDVCLPETEAAEAALIALGDGNREQDERSHAPARPTEGRADAPIVRLGQSVATDANPSGGYEQGETASGSVMIGLLVAGLLLTGGALLYAWKARAARQAERKGSQPERDEGERRRPGARTSNESRSAASARRASRPLVSSTSASAARSERQTDLSSAMPMAPHLSLTPRSGTRDTAASAPTLEDERPLDGRPERRLVPSLRRDSAEDETFGREDTLDIAGKAAWKAHAQSLAPQRVFSTTDLSPIRGDADLHPPVSVEVALHIVDHLLAECDRFRELRGYGDVFLVEGVPGRIRFHWSSQVGLRVGVPTSALVPTRLAADAIRRSSLMNGIRPDEAHVLSLIRVVRERFGVFDMELDPRSFDELVARSASLDDRTAKVIEHISETGGVRVAPDEDASFAISVMTRQGFQQLRKRLTERVADVPSEPSIIEATPCPACGDTVAVRALACNACGLPVHPIAFFCPECGTQNVLRADGISQTCRSRDCDAVISDFAPTREYEQRRNARIFRALSSFDDFSRLPPVSDEERFGAILDGVSVEIILSSSAAPPPLTESSSTVTQALSRVRFPSLVKEESGMRLIIYPRRDGTPTPIWDSSPKDLAIGLFELANELAEGGLAIGTARAAHFSITPAGQVQLSYGHLVREDPGVSPWDEPGEFDAPEVSVTHEYSEKSDLYLLASLWHEIIRGSPRPDDATANEVPADLLIEPHVWSTLLACLSREPLARPSSAREVLARLKNQRRLSDLI